MARVRLVDLGRELGVSAATVSRALSGSLEIGADTRARVAEAARRAGYVADLGAVQLANRRMRRASTGLVPVAYVVQARHEDPQRVFRPHGEFVVEEGRRMGYAVSLQDVARAASLRSLLRILRARGVRALILDRLTGDLAEFATVDWSDFVVVNMDRRLREPRFDGVRYEVVEAIQESWARMRAAGRKRVGFALLEHEREHPDDFSRVAIAEKLLGVAGRRRIFLFGPEAQARQGAGIAAWVRRERLDGVIAFSPTVYWWLSSTGIAIPGQLGLCLLHHAEETEHSIVFSGYETNRREAAKAALRHLDQSLRHGELGERSHPVQIVVRRRWRDGATL